MSRTLGDVEGVAFSLNSLGIAAQGRRDREQARKMWEECKRLALEHGLEDRLAIATLNLSGLALTENRPDEAHVLAAQAAEIFARTQSPLWCNTLLLLGEAARLSGRDADAEGHLRKCLDACVRRRGRATGGAALRSLAALCLAHGEDRRAAVLLGAAGAVLGDAGMSSRVDDVEELEPNVLGEIPRPDLEELIDEGRSMSFEDAARYVLDTPGPFIASASEERG
jgi:hypothetical protein